MEEPASTSGQLPSDPMDSYDPRRSWARHSNAGTMTAPTFEAHAPEIEVTTGVDYLYEVVGAPRSPVDPPVADGFRFLNQIGRGGFGDVWSAYQTSLGREVAIKLLRPRSEGLSPAEESFMAQLRELNFRQEALTAATLTHPNICPVYDLATDAEGRPLLVMMRARGHLWQTAMESEWERLSPRDYLTRHVLVLLDVAKAVAYAHSRGIVHRDLKPGQVMLGEFGEVVLMDWGLAVVHGRKAPHSQPSTTDAEAPRHPLPELLDIVPSTDSAENPAGTPAYMAPEQTESNARRIGPWTDVYLLGGILYYILTRRPPHVGPTAAATLVAASRGEITPVERAAPPGRPLPRALVSLCLRCLDPDPEQRPRDAFVFLQDLQHTLAETFGQGTMVGPNSGVAMRLDDYEANLAASEATVGPDSVAAAVVLPRMRPLPEVTRPNAPRASTPRRTRPRPRPSRAPLFIVALLGVIVGFLLAVLLLG